MKPDTPLYDRSANSFRTTNWTQVVTARGNSPEARQALSDLCAAYYAPVELFIRRYCGMTAGANHDAAREMTHDFFARLLEGDALNHAERKRGRFRSYLLGAVKHFLADRSDYLNRIKRGAGCVIQSLSGLPEETSGGTDGADLVSDRHGFPADAVFDRQWAVTTVEQAIEILRQDAVAAGEQDRFETLRQWLISPVDKGAYTSSARDVQMSAGAFKLAVHRLRKRFRQLVTDQITATVHDPQEVTEELNYLIGALMS